MADRKGSPGDPPGDKGNGQTPPKPDTLSSQEPELLSSQKGGTGPVIGGVLGGGARSDARMIERAIREKWPITDEIRKLATQQMAITVGRSESERARIAAARVLAVYDRVNVQRESNLIAEERARSPEAHQHVHFEALNEGRDIIARVLARIEARGSNGDTPGATDDGPGGGNGQPGGNGSKSSPSL